MRERIRVRRGCDDDPYPRADVEPWPDEPGAAVTGADIGVVEDRLMALFERIAAAQERDAAAASTNCSASRSPVTTPESGCTRWLPGVPMGQADRYAVLAAPTAAARLEALRDAVETVAAMIEFQLSES